MGVHTESKVGLCLHNSFLVPPLIGSEWLRDGPSIVVVPYLNLRR